MMDEALHVKLIGIIKLSHPVNLRFLTLRAKLA